ncbi:amino acid transporter [Acidisoma cellulosilytica]|uniref:Amino acid transporter n=1 Tax=Acidisoma cellulosilyticum TaxID=2802395 RepID=A0A964E2F9_9PROT|nr:LysE/ArgO family amino acid transporter [Acidisoma cellulosilyticum]MCB8879570.1 amino acid transporter [Acidisoma cellulosilyticum]
MSVPVFLTGLAMGLSLIVAIGAQNAFVLRQGLLGRFVWPVTLVCALSDTVLIVVGVLCFHQVAQVLPAFEPVMRYGGAAFLTLYAARNLHSAFTGSGALAAAETDGGSLSKTILLCLALTWLNPHVYLDTLVLLGSLSAQFHGQQMSFATGAITGSFLFFIALGQGAAWLRPLLARPRVWQAVEVLIALTMAATALRLVLMR